MLGMPKSSLIMLRLSRIGVLPPFFDNPLYPSNILRNPALEAAFNDTMIYITILSVYRQFIT